MNLFERAIGALAPGWALSRARARMAWQVFSHAEALGYDAGALGRRSENWKTTGGSANSEISPSITRARNRSRDMVRNNPYAKSAIAKLVARTVGTGILARWPKSVKPVWKEFVETCDYEGQHDFYGLQNLVGRTVYEAGECLVRRIRGPMRQPLQLQVLEPDYLDSLKFGPIAGGNFVIAGIEVDRSGRRQAYWLYPNHPGEVVQIPKTFQSVRVPASEILHVYEKERPGQLRGMPRLSASLMRLRDVDEYQDAQMMRKKIEACFAAFVQSAAGSSLPIAEGANLKTDAAGRRIETLSPGIIWYGKPGETIEFGGPSGSTARDEYTNDQLHAIAAGAGVTYEQLTGDFSQVTYLSARGALLEFRELIEVFRWIHFIPMFCRGAAHWFVDASYTAGRVRTDSYPALEWTPPSWPWVDPLKDTQAALLEVEGRLASRSEKQRERGHDPDELRDEIKHEQQEDKKAGLEPVKPAGAASPTKDDSADAGKDKGKADDDEDK